MSRTTERLVALAAVVIVAIGGYRLSEVSTCKAANKSHGGTLVLAEELADAFAPLDDEDRARIKRVREANELQECSWMP